MISAHPHRVDSVDVGVAARPAAGQTVSGDDHVFVASSSSCLLSVIDGLGHGRDAHVAAVTAKRAIEMNHDHPLKDIFALVADELANVRGACVALLRISFERHELECGAVGNVEILAASKAPIRPFPSRGIVGHKGSYAVRTFEFPLTAGDRLAVFSDGISRRRLELDDYKTFPPQQAAEAILKNHSVTHDDATCLVVDYYPVKRKPCPSRRPPRL